MGNLLEDMRREYFEIGRKAGRKEASLNVARKLLKLGKGTTKDIATISGLPIDEVKRLQAEQGA